MEQGDFKNFLSGINVQMSKNQKLVQTLNNFYVGRKLGYMFIF